MNKKYLMNGFAALALIASVSSCTKDVTAMSQADQEAAAKENAELQLGLNIPDGQTWDMSTQVTAVVDVNLNPSETYTVGICDKNPLTYDDAKFYVLKKVEGGRISATFTAPIAKTDYYVVAYNSKYQAIVNRANASNGAINATISYTSSAEGTMRSASRRATAHGITFPDAPAATDFKTTYPDGTKYLGTYGAGDTFYADERNNGQNIQLNPGWDNEAQKSINGGPLYIVSSSGEKVTIAPSYFYYDARGEGGAYLYICPNVTLKLKESDAKNLQAGLKIYIAEGATLESEGDLVLNSVYIYNAGTITVPGDLSLNGGNDKDVVSSLLYNVGNGEINVTGSLKPKNGGCYVINQNKITAAEFGSEGSATLWNVDGGEIEIEGQTLIDSNSNGWINDGQYTTGTFQYTAGSPDVYNSCKLTVNELFEMNLGDSPTSAFYNEGSIVCEKDFLLSGPGRIIMSSNSVVDVAGTATMKICNPRKYGIFGPESGNFAVFKANNVVKGEDNQGLVSYGGNLAVVCNSHFEQGWKGQYPIIAGGGEDGSGPTEVTIYQGGEMPDIPTIEPTLCNPGFEPTPGTGNFLNEPQVYTYAFEDQKVNGDYDMNDVVLKISYHAVRDEEGNITEIQQNKLDVKMVAAGATFNLEAYVGDHKLFDNEVHAAFGVDPGLMVNTGRNTATIIPEDLDIDAPEGWDGDFKNLDVKIHVLVSEPYWIEYLTDKEKVSPYAIMIPNDWRWPTERTCVTEAYPGKNTANAGEPVVFDDEYSFRKWAETPNDERTDAMKSWFNYYLEGKTMTNASATNN